MGRFLYILTWWSVELAQEVAADVAAECGFDEGQVFCVMVVAEGDAQEFFEAFGDVVGEPVAVEHGDGVVGVGQEGDAVDRVIPSGAQRSRGILGVGRGGRFLTPGGGSE